MSRRINNLKNFELCRFCNHYYAAHTDSKWKPTSCQNIVTFDKFKPCKCPEFFSKDNLEFLEQKYDKIKSL